MRAWPLHLISLACTGAALVLNKFVISRLGALNLGLVNCAAALLSLSVHRRLTAGEARQDSKPFQLWEWAPGVANAAGLYFMMSALLLLNPATVSLFNRLYLVFGAALAVVVFRERCRPGQLMGVGAMLVGVAVFSFHPWGDGESTRGLVFAALAPLCFALANAGLKHRQKDAPLRQLSLLTGLSFLVLLSVRLGRNGFAVPADVGGRSLATAAVAGVLGSHLGLWFFMRGLRRSTFMEANLMRALSPLVTAVVSAPFFGFAWSYTELAGSSLILCGMMLYAMSAKKNLSAPEGVTFKEGPVPSEFDSVLVLLKDAAKWVLARNSVRGGWEFPGGHREAGEDYRATAHREALEEAGVTLRNLRYVGFYELQKQKNHRTIVVQAEVDEWKDIPVGFETSTRALFETLPEDLTFKDGLYAYLLKLC